MEYNKKKSKPAENTENGLPASFKTQRSLTQQVSYNDYFEYCKKERHYEPYALGDWKKCYAEMMNITFEIENKKILDVGCAGGTIAFAFSEYGADVSGCDINAAVIENCPFEKIKSRLQVIETTDLDKIFPDNTFDFIHSHQVFEHFPSKEYSTEVIKKIYRILKAGGICYIVLVTGEHFTQEDLIEIHRRGEDVDVTHINIWPMKWWRDLFNSFGFIDITDIFSPIIDCYQSKTGISFFKKYGWHQFCYAKDSSYDFYLNLGKERITKLLKRQKYYADVNIYKAVIQHREVNEEIAEIIKDFSNKQFNIITLPLTLFRKTADYIHNNHPRVFNVVYPVYQTILSKLKRIIRGSKRF